MIINGEMKNNLNLESWNDLVFQADLGALQKLCETFLETQARCYLQANQGSCLGKHFQFI